jgi:hypothetical protein
MNLFTGFLVEDDAYLSQLINCYDNYTRGHKKRDHPMLRLTDLLRQTIKHILATKLASPPHQGVES